MTRVAAVVNNASMFADGASSGVTYMKTKKLHYKYQSIEKIKSVAHKIHASQEKAIVKAYNKFKAIKNSVFYQRNLQSNPTIYNAVTKSNKRKKDEDSDFNQPSSPPTQANKDSSN